MTAQQPDQQQSSSLASIVTVAAVAAATFFVLQAGAFEPDHGALEQAVSAKLRDPSSAQFQNIYGDGDTYCGEVNARNGMGGYAGYRDFVSRRGIVLIEPQLRRGATTAEQARHYEELARFARLQQQCRG